jgi:hypothetical protein
MLIKWVWQAKLAEEDPTFTVRTDELWSNIILYG